MDGTRHDKGKTRKYAKFIVNLLKMEEVKTRAAVVWKCNENGR
jgi:hypothetical protein